jgi:DNA repair exonuclease SbcCD ATPase subunit
MKLEKLKINGFGKLKNCDLKFTDKINIVHGKNEAGKSTLLRFITGSLFGISKNKEGKEIADFEKYKPWDGTEYSGKISYTLDDGNYYEVFRDFEKRKATIYDKKGNDITSSFSQEKNKGSNFFIDQVGLDEKLFMASNIAGQAKVKLDEASQGNLVHKLSNLVTTGDDQINYKKVKGDLDKLQTEKIGSNKTTKRPINLVDEEIKQLSARLEELEKQEVETRSGSSNKNELQNELEKNKSIGYFLGSLKACYDNYRTQEAELKALQNLHEETNNKLTQVKSKIDDKAEDNIKSQKFNTSKYIIPFIITIIICAIIIYCVPEEFRLYSLASIVLPIIISIVFVVNKIRFNKRIKEQLDDLSDLKDNVKAQIQILNENLEEQAIKYDVKKVEYEKALNEDRTAIQDDFKEDLGLPYVMEIMALSNDELNLEYTQNQNITRALEFKLNNIKNNEANLQRVNEQIEEVKYKLNKANEQKQELEKLNKSFELAKACLEEAYQEIKTNLSPEFISELSNTISKVTDNKYNNIKITDDDGLLVEAENGKYVPIENYLSIGTIDQMYMALRLNSIKEISKETLPIILDEVFVYFDSERLANILKFINDNYDNQILIFSCSDREKKALDELKIKYNLIELK